MESRREVGSAQESDAHGTDLHAFVCRGANSFARIRSRLRCVRKGGQ
jgi:hypothetical protein